MSSGRTNYHEILYPESAKGVDSLLWKNRLYYYPNLPISSLVHRYTLDGLIASANSNIANGWIRPNLEFQPAFELANMVKINAMLPSIIRRGVLKPFLVTLTAEDQPLQVETGDSRLACLELTAIESVPAILVDGRPRQQQSSLPGHLDHGQPLRDLQDLAQACGIKNTVFYMDFDHNNQLIYYNYNLGEPSGIDVQGWEYRLKILQRYLDGHWHPRFEFSRQWLNCAVPWREYQ